MDIPESFSIHADFAKRRDDLQVVYGWASVSKDGGVEVVDSQGDMIDIEDLRKAVWDFMEGDRTGGTMHLKTADGETIRTGKVVDSLVVTSDLAKVLGMDEGREGWLIGMHIEDKFIWDMVKSGELRGFSIGGKGIREAIS